MDPVGGRQLNFGGGGPGGTSGLVVVSGQVGPQVARLVFVPVEGTKAIDVPLLPAPRPGSGPVYAPGHLPLPPSAYDPTPSGHLEDRRVDGARNFAIAVTRTDHALLLAYDAAGHLIADGGEKLRMG
ncbi:hypothetical protein [Yinghuangia sp. YIM S10712]|uniref:hypothetical protein n=1 Tax=Yinghuangia sp. YIM S10712 TaxID=3436930 RepID=UPI003F52C372